MPRKAKAYLRVACCAGLAVIALATTAAGETIKIGMLKTMGTAPIFIAQERGYFKAEGLDVENVFFEAGQPVAVAVVSGSIDFGSAGLSAGLYALAGQGALTLIAGQSREVPGFPNGTYMVSNKAWDQGVRSFKDIPTHSVAMTAMGSPFHYGLALLAKKYGFDLATVRLLPLQSIPNNVSAVIGGTADVAMATSTLALPVVSRGDVKVLGYVGDETPWQVAATFTSTRTANEKRDLVERFLRAYIKGSRDAHDAFADADDKRLDGPATAEVLAIMSKYMGQPASLLATGVQFLDRDARLDTRDIMNQIEWYRAQGMLKVDVSPDQIMDKRYVRDLSGK